MISFSGGQPSEGANSAQPQTETATAMEVSPGKPKEGEKEDEREEPRERLSERLADLNGKKVLLIKTSFENRE